MTLDLSESRYDRQELISWWNQGILSNAKVLVVGAGALGNEVVKNLALLGLGHVTVIDLDTVATSNLSRCVLFREGDQGQYKAEIVATRSMELNPNVSVSAVVGNVTHQGVGWLSKFDVVIGCLDNRESRLWVNQASRKLGITWIDGAIEGIRGVVKVFPPKGACYECTLGEKDLEILSHRRACSLLTATEIELGKTPTTATSSSVIAGFQVQEAIRVLHGETSPISNSGWTFIGETFDTYTVAYSENEMCQAHVTYDWRVWECTVSHSLKEVIDEIGLFQDSDCSILLEREIVRSVKCLNCEWLEVVNRSLDSVSRESATCPHCNEVGQLDLVTTFGKDDILATLSFGDLELPNDEVVTFSDGVSFSFYLLRMHIA